MKTLYLCGASNPEGVRLALKLNRAGSLWERVVLLDDDPRKHGTSILGVSVVGPFAMLAEAASGSAEVVNLVARTTAKRLAARRSIERYGVPFCSLVHPDVDIEGAVLEDDVTVYGGASVCALSAIGRGSVIFMGAVVGHAARIGRCCVLAPNAVLNARVVLDDAVYVGTNASILPDLRIGAGAIVSAGSVVVRNVPPDTTVLGNPARALPTDPVKRRAPWTATRA